MRFATLVVGLAVAVAPSRARADSSGLTCSELTAKGVKEWRATIQIRFETRLGLQVQHASGEASYTARLRSDVLPGVQVTWPGFNQSWLGQRLQGSIRFHEQYGRESIDASGPVLSPEVGNWDGLGIDPTTTLQIDTVGCRYALHVGAAGIPTGGPGRPNEPSRAVGFSGSIPVQAITGAIKELRGAVTMQLPKRKFDLIDSFFYTCRSSECAKARGDATITWTLIPVTEGKVEITALDLRDISNQPLQFVSVSPCSWCGGNPRIHGTIAIEGDADDRPAAIELELLAGDTRVAGAAIAPGPGAILLQPFGPARRVEIATPQLLFPFTADALSGVDQLSDGRLALRVQVRTAKGRQTGRALPVRLPKLVNYTSTNRYGPRDPHLGGDSWVKPTVRPIIERFGATYLWSDFSNMHGGSFNPPHASHDRGNDVDGRFSDGSIERDWGRLGYHTAATARRLLDVLAGPDAGRIVCIGLTYKQTAADPFWMAIKDVRLPDGRRAPDVIRPWKNHGAHFHFRISDAGDRPYSRCGELRTTGVP